RAATTTRMLAKVRRGMGTSVRNESGPRQYIRSPADDRRRRLIPNHSRGPTVNDHDRFLREHRDLTRRYFLGLLAGSAVAGIALGDDDPGAKALAAAIDKIEPHFTPPADFRDVSRGSPVPHSLSDEKKRKAGLTRETWKLEVISDPDNPAKLGKQLTAKDGT